MKLKNAELVCWICIWYLLHSLGRFWACVACLTILAICSWLQLKLHGSQPVCCSDPVIRHTHDTIDVRWLHNLRNSMSCPSDTPTIMLQLNSNNSCHLCLASFHTDSSAVRLLYTLGTKYSSTNYHYFYILLSYESWYISV